jgi:hypothetical protein
MYVDLEGLFLYAMPMIPTIKQRPGVILSIVSTAEFLVSMRSRYA